MNTCGNCKYWDIANKRNCSTKESPRYYADCMFPIDSLVPPFCVAIEQTSENNGVGCPRYETAKEKE